MSSKRYPEEFKIEEVKQIEPLSHWYPVGWGQHSLFEVERLEVERPQAELRRLSAELKRITEECDILKRPLRTLPRNSGEIAFIKQHDPQYLVRRLCRVMQANRAGYYA